MNLSQSQIDFIINLSTEMRTQDIRCTAQPYGLILTQEVIEIRGEDYANECGAYWNEREYYDWKEFVEDVLDYLEDNEDDDTPEWALLLNECNTFSDLEYKLPSHQNGDEPNIFWYERTQVPTKMNSNFFLTEKAYHEHIRVNGHNLIKPQSYGIHLKRNREMEQVIEAIHAIASQLLNNTEQVKTCDGCKYANIKHWKCHECIRLNCNDYYEPKDQK